LPRTRLGDHLEQRIWRLMQDMPEHSDITVRVVSVREKTVPTQPGIRAYYRDAAFPEELPYRAKALFMFQRQEGSEVCLFAMHVQEYGSECPEPNARRVYLSYLDSIFYFTPRVRAARCVLLVGL
jgi:E1A/CREB-binding protein